MLESFDLAEGVDDDSAHACFQGHLQFGDRLVVPVKHKSISRDPCGKGDVQFATGGNIEGHAFHVGEPCHRGAHERFGRVCHPVWERGHCLPAAGPQLGLVVDEQRCPVLVRQCDEIAAANGEPTVRGNDGAVGE